MILRYNKQDIQYAMAKEDLHVKRILWAGIIILIICMSACIPSIASFDEDDDEMEFLYYGDYAYTLENGQVTIVGCNGSGGSPDWDDEDSGLQNRPGKSDEAATFTDYIYGKGTFRIPDRLNGYPVVAIGEFGLSESYISDITIPDGLTSIGDYAFSLCYWTHAITVPDSVTWIGEGAFDADCYAMLRVNEGSYAAQYAEEYDIPYTYNAEYTVFSSGDWLYTLMDGTARIYGYLGSASYGIGYAGEQAIPEYLDGYLVTAIECGPFPYTFDMAENLTSVTLPGSLTSIDDYVFSECYSLASVTIPGGCVSIGEGAFDDCPNLTLTVAMGSYAAEYARKNGIPYEYSKEPEEAKMDDVLRLAIFPTGTYEESYYFILRQDGTLFCAIGSRKSDEIAQPNFLKSIYSSAELVLAASDFQCLVDLSDELEASYYHFPKQAWTDSWDVALLYNGKVYEMNYWYNDNSETFIDLVDKVMELSPMPVDLHGWA